MPLPLHSVELATLHGLDRHLPTAPQHLPALAQQQPGQPPYQHHLPKMGNSVSVGGHGTQLLGTWAAT